MDKSVWNFSSVGKAFNASGLNLTSSVPRSSTTEDPVPIATPDPVPVATPDPVPTAIPNISIPNIAIPSIAIPSISIPNIATPNIAAPNIATPNIAAPNIAAPNIAAPDIAIPDSVPSLIPSPWLLFTMVVSRIFSKIFGSSGGSAKPCDPSVWNYDPQLSFSLLFLAHFGAALTLFLAMADFTTVSMSLPTIVSEFGASQIQCTWVAVAYILTQTAGQPLYGKFSDLFGRKVVLYASMFTFCIASLLSAASQSITWLIVSRALSGIGAGGIVNSVWTITFEIVPLHKRALWSQALSLTWASSAVAGLQLSGLISGQSGYIFSWRWLLFMNLPLCLVASAVLLVSLRNVNLERRPKTSWPEFFSKFDFIGLFAFMSGISLLIIGFSFVTRNGWTAPATLGLIMGGMIFLALGHVYEIRTSREALFPPQLFKDISCVSILVVVFLHSFCFTAGTFYITIYFQAVNGITPYYAGIATLPYLLGATLSSIPAAWLLGFWQNRRGNMTGQKWVTFVGLNIGALGFALMISLDELSNSYMKTLFPLIAGIGLGVLIYAPYQVFTRAFRLKDMAVGTSAFFLLRFMGAVVGLSLAGSVFNTRLDKMLPEGYPENSRTINLSTVHLITPPELREEVVRAIARSIQTIWMICSPFLGLAALLTMQMKTNFVTERETAEEMLKHLKDLESVASSSSRSNEKRPNLLFETDPLMNGE